MLNETTKPNKVVFFLPGIMGSTLRLRGRGFFGEILDEMVWSSDAESNFDLLASMPYKLASDDIEPIDVLRTLRVSKWDIVDIYGKFLAFCTSNQGLGLHEGSDFFPFPYDWRRDNRITALKLTEFVRRIDPEGQSRYYFIAHSMGGIITRLMLQDQRNASIASRTNMLVQIASPISGAAKAFYSLRHRPRFNTILDACLAAIHRFNPQKYYELRKTIESLASLYQLIPLETIIVTQSGHKLSALNEQVWPSAAHPLVRGGRVVQRTIKKDLPCPIHCFYGTGFDTDDMYVIDNDFRIQRTMPRVRGDGTVTEASATAQSSNLHLINSRHDRICSDEGFWDDLKSLFEAEAVNV